MVKNELLVSMQICFYLVVLLVAGAKAGQLRVYNNNPLNNRAVDLFMVVDESNSRLTQIQFSQMKIALANIATDLQPAGSSPFFGVFFYGSTSTVHTVVPFTTTYASVVKVNLEQKQYTPTQTNPSTLASALDVVDASCQAYCRSTVPRVTVVFSTAPDYLAESRIRQLEHARSMTVIVIGIGFSANTAVLNSLASHPSRIYALPFDSFTELIVSTSFISNLISDVARLLTVGSTLSVASISTGVYYTVQLNTYGYITTNDTVVTFTTNCNACSVYASLSQPNPTSVNTVQNTNRQNFYAPGYTYSVFYFRIPKNANRFFLSFLGSAMSSVTGIFNVFNFPQMMQISTRDVFATDLAESLG